jgi:hypothetical protein
MSREIRAVEKKNYRIAGLTEPWLHEELAYFATGGDTVVGVLIRDQVDHDYGYVILIKEPQNDELDGSGLYRCVNLIYSIPAADEAIRRLHADMLEEHEVTAIIRPQPRSWLGRLYKQYGSFVPIWGPVGGKPTRSSTLLYRIVQAFSREIGLGQWSKFSGAEEGYIITDPEGRALGGFGVRWREYTNTPDCWRLEWIWIAPGYRRQGWLRRSWEMVDRNYPGIVPDKPFSAGTEAFFATQPAVLARLAEEKRAP